MKKTNHLGKVKKGKDVIVLNIIAYSFCGRCKSINMKPQGDELFTCIWTACPERKVGDQTR